LTGLVAHLGELLGLPLALVFFPNEVANLCGLKDCQRQGILFGSSHEWVESVENLRTLQKKLPSLSPVVVGAHVPGRDELREVGWVICLGPWIRLAGDEVGFDPVKLPILLGLVESAKRNGIDPHPSAILADSCGADCFAVYGFLGRRGRGHENA
jgi:hypothetical protein